MLPFWLKTRMLRRFYSKLTRRPRVEPVEHSTFTNLWPFEPGAARRIAAEVASNTITPAEADALRHFSENGWVVFEGCVSPRLIDELVEDVRRIADHPGRFLLTDHKNGRTHRLSGPDFDEFESIFDTYVNLERAREVCFHPRIVRFLGQVFQTRPFAHQQLLFQRSNQHPIHQDTAYVCVEEPLLMVASWIALEDVIEGRGELTYYDGSHRIPHYTYADGSKRFDPERDDARAARQHVLEHCERLGCAKRSFLARKGDVFLWAADLAHGSNPRTRPESETRKSLVTHYSPEGVLPFWFRFHPGHRTIVEHDASAVYASSHYRLPKPEAFAEPTTRPG